MSKRKKHEEHEEHENHERWLVSYADMVTVLMALFIVMYAMSTVDQAKFDALKSGLAEGFGQKSILSGHDSVLSEANAPMGGITPELATQELNDRESQAVQAALRTQNTMAAGRARADAEAEVDRLNGVYSRLQAALKKHGLQDDVQATYDDRGLVVSLVSRHVVFAADLATLTERGREIVDTLAPVLREIPDPLQIDGHTNQASGKPRYYPSDWDLASARAITVLRRLSEEQRIPGERLTAASYGHERPLIDPRKPGSQEINKRVDIVLVSGESASTRALLAEVAKEKQQLAAAAKAAEAAETEPTTDTTDTPDEHDTTTDHETTAEGAH
ncbi:MULTISPECIES: flagellar motor protein MotB [unclassified Nocardioides]|uniref:flagellar motor protein MotB n=1 Tax=unclassified Nocardioides TaxID=2615069 RepID=UPI003014471D